MLLFILNTLIFSIAPPCLFENLPKKCSQYLAEILSQEEISFKKRESLSNFFQIFLESNFQENEIIISHFLNSLSLIIINNQKNLPQHLEEIFYLLEAMQTFNPLKFRYIIQYFYTPIFEKALSYKTKNPYTHCHPLLLFIKYLIHHQRFAFITITDPQTPYLLYTDLSQTTKINALSLLQFLLFKPQLQNIIDYLNKEYNQRNSFLTPYPSLHNLLLHFIKENEDQLKYPPIKWIELQKFLVNIRQKAYLTQKPITLFLSCYHKRETEFNTTDYYIFFNLFFYTYEKFYLTPLTNYEKEMFEDTLKCVNDIANRKQGSIEFIEFFEPLLSDYIASSDFDLVKEQLLEIIFKHFYIPYYQNSFSHHTPHRLFDNTRLFSYRLFHHPFYVFMKIFRKIVKFKILPKEIEKKNLEDILKMIKDIPLFICVKDLIFSPYNEYPLENDLKELFEGCDHFFENNEHSSLDIIRKELDDQFEKLKLSTQTSLRDPHASYTWPEITETKDRRLSGFLLQCLIASHAKNFHVPNYHLPPIESKKIFQEDQLKQEMDKLDPQPIHKKKGRTRIFASRTNSDILCIKIKNEMEESNFYQELDTMALTQKEAQKLHLPYSQVPLGRCLYNKKEALAYKAQADSFIYANEIKDPEKMRQALERGLELYASLSAHHHLYHNEITGLSHGKERSWHISKLLIGSHPGSVQVENFEYPNMTLESIRDTGDFWRTDHPLSYRSFTDNYYYYIGLSLDPFLYYNTPLHQSFSVLLMWIQTHRQKESFKDEKVIQKYTQIFIRFFAISLSTFHKKKLSQTIKMIEEKYISILQQGVFQILYFTEPNGLKFEVDNFEQLKSFYYEQVYGTPLTFEIQQLILKDPTYSFYHLTQFGLRNSSFPAPQLIEFYLYLFKESIVMGKDKDYLNNSSQLNTPFHSLHSLSSSLKYIQKHTVSV